MMKRNSQDKRTVRYLSPAISLGIMVGLAPHLSTTHAQVATSGASQRVEPVTVTGRKLEDQTPDLEKTSETGSRLGLTIRETPASVEVMTQEVMERRGARTLEDALRGGVGVIAGGNPGSPSVVSTRGFVGGFVTYLFDGDRIATAGMSSRPQDTFNYERIEVLKGPSSVLFGEGGIGGSVNFVTKRPDRSAAGFEGVLAYGSYDSLRAGVGTGGSFGPDSGYRLDFSHQYQGDGWVGRTGHKLSHFTSGVNFKLTPNVSVDFSLDYLNDDVKSYWGTPLIPAAFATEASNAVIDSTGRVLDRRIARNNYNVEDGRMKADSVWARARLSWQLNPQWSLKNQLSIYSADRDWRNAEGAVFVAPNRVNRDLVNITHDHQVWSNLLDLSHKGELFGLKSRTTFGLEYARTDFSTERRFSDGSASTVARLQVDALNPVVGNYLTDLALFTGGGNRTNFGTDIQTTAVFAENALTLLPNFTLVTGLRGEQIKLSRTVQDLNTSASTAFGKTYRPNSVRVGGVFDLSKATTLYAQYANAAAPVGTSNLLLLSSANTAFPLTRGTQLELGLKQSIGRDFDWTLALYRIEQDNVLSRDAVNPAVTVNSGKIGSRGVELSAAWRATNQLTVSGNVALLNAEFRSLVEAGGVSRVGNTPPNVPEKTANAWVDYRFATLPLSVGASLNWVDKRYNNNANTVFMNSYATADLYATWKFKPVDLTLRVRNVTDKFYASWSGSSSANQVLVGAPRTVELTAKFGF
ncbi:MAG: TonB-dependent siderophore receptor [Betaproteobacteria bacterium]|nr:MAG: TonB-dependent siderophore receptor [Betaproteobacteria bacterium]